MELNLTNEEIEAIKYYKEKGFLAINQLLIADSRTDIALLNDDIEINYDKTSTINYIDTIKKIYKAIFKYYLGKGKKEKWSFTRVTTTIEMERLKNELFIDRFILASNDSKMNKDLSINNNVAVYIDGDENIPYIKLDDILQDGSKDVIISLFTKVLEVSEVEDINFNDKSVRTYKISLEKQDLQGITEDDKIALYNYIISNSDLINTTLMDTVNLEKENVANYESIRELEKELSDLELESNKEDTKEIKEKLDIFKTRSAQIFDDIKRNNKFITEWKKNITVYLMNECINIEKEVIEEMKAQNESAEKKAEEFQEYARTKAENLAKEKFENIFEEVKAECQDNLQMCEKLMSDIDRVINRQQNFAKIAGNLGASYSALNNAFEMKRKAEDLENVLNTIKLKVETIGNSGTSKDNSDKLLKISEVNNQIGILINYLNNPKTAIAKSKMNRFDEMIVVEENELKRDIAKALLDIRGEAELKKLRDDTKIIESKSPISKLLGIFTGQNKLDEFMLDQIELRQNSIKKTLSKKLRLDYNYSVHELIAEIRMFIKDNSDDELVADDVAELKEFEKEIAKNFVVIESKVNDILDEKENRNLPVDTKITKRELIEIETYRFLNKYGYDIANKQEPEEVEYIDTTAREIAKISDYISTSKILE